MECLIQYLDDLEDAVYAVALVGERLRRMARTLLIAAVLLLVQGLGVLAAVNHPPLALAVVSLITVGMLYRGAVTLTPVISRS